MHWDEWRGSMDGRPTLWVKRLFRWRDRRIDLHKITGLDDAGCFHSHPAWAIRVVLRGGYVEEMPDGTTRTWRPGMIGFVRPEFVHRVAGLLKTESYSLWLRGRIVSKTRLVGDGWLAQKQTHRVPNTVLG